MSSESPIMNYQGNPSLAQDVQERISNTFQQTLDLVTGQRVGKQTRGDAAILTAYLDAAVPGGGPIWAGWTTRAGSSWRAGPRSASPWRAGVSSPGGLKRFTATRR